MVQLGFIALPDAVQLPMGKCGHPRGVSHASVWGAGVRMLPHWPFCPRAPQPS